MSEEQELRQQLIKSFSDWVKAAFPVEPSRLSEELQSLVIQGFTVNLDRLINLVKVQN